MGQLDVSVGVLTPPTQRHDVVDRRSEWMPEWRERIDGAGANLTDPAIPIANGVPRYLVTEGKISDSRTLSVAIVVLRPSALADEGTVPPLGAGRHHRSTAFATFELASRPAVSGIDPLAVATCGLVSRGAMTLLAP